VNPSHNPQKKPDGKLERRQIRGYPSCRPLLFSDSCCNQMGRKGMVSDGMLYAPKLSTRSVLHCLLLKDQWRPADPLHLEVDRHFDTVGDLDEGNAFIHPIILTIESHCPFNITRT
jgi:hypothetical protein